MAEVTAMRNNIINYPIYAAPYTVVFPILDADGDLVTGAADLDSEVSKNGDTFADCTNEATEIATNSGMYYLTLTGAEMVANVASIIVKTSTSGAKTTPIVLYPRVLSTLRTNTAQAGGAATITLDASASIVDEAYRGNVIHIYANTGIGQLRAIISYVGSTKVATVYPAWTTEPDDTSSFHIYQTDIHDITGACQEALNIAIPASPVANSPFERIATLDNNYTATRAGYLDELAAANLPTDIAAITAAGPTKAEMDTAHALLATEAKQDIIDTNMDKVITAMELDGAVYRFTENALEQAPSGTGGDATAANQETLIQILTGKWEITGNQFIIYDSDGTTALYTFDLTQDGVPTEFNPDKRVRV